MKLISRSLSSALIERLISGYPSLAVEKGSVSMAVKGLPQAQAETPGEGGGGEQGGQGGQGQALKPA